MSNFSIKRLRVTIVLNKGSFEGQNKANTVTLEGYRMSATIAGDGADHAQSRLDLRIWGLRDALMQQMYMVAGTETPEKIQPRAIRVEAQNGDGPYEKVFEGTVHACMPDYNAAPNVSVQIVATAAAWWQHRIPAANSGKGEFAVADLISGLAKSIQFAFKNNGVTAKVRDYNVSGSAVAQIRSLAQMANIMCNIDRSKVTIWPNGQAVDKEVIKLSPETGLVGYPVAVPNGIEVVCIHNQNIENGRKVHLDTSLTTLAGDWYVHSCSHVLESELPGGKWFTTARLFRSAVFKPMN